MDKNTSRLRRARKTRMKIRELGMHRLSVHRTSMHTYAQIISPDARTTLVSASTVDKELRGKLKHGANTEAATEVGKLLAARAKDAGIEKVAFDRGGFKFHGRVKALADAAREGGLQF